MKPDRALLEERLLGQMDRLRWLINLRWVAVFGIAAASVTTHVTGYTLWVVPPWFLVPFVLVYNLAFTLWLRRARRAQWPPARTQRSLRWQGILQAICDMVAMVLLVYLDGGVEYPLFYAPLLAVMLSSLLLPRWGLFIQANLGAALFALMALGEYQGWLPHVDFLQLPYRHDLYRDSHGVGAIVLSMATMLNLTAFLMSSLGERLNQAEARSRGFLEQLRRTVIESSGQLARAVEGMQGGAQEIDHVAEQIASTVQEIARGAGQQAGQLDQLSRSLEHLAEAARRVAEGTQETHQAAGEAVATADRGRQAAQEATGRMDEIARVFARAEQALSGLALHSKEIAEVALAIDRFAERTDLLALNAGIEAARAGAHGRGFAIVAGEVKKLAASSSASAEQVAQRVAQIQAEIDSVLGAVQAGLEPVRDGQQAIATLQEVVEGMSAVIARTDELAGTIRHLALQQREAHQEISRTVAEVASTAEQTAAGAEETAAAVEQQVSSFAEFSQAVEALVELAARLDRSVTDLYEGAASEGPIEAGNQSPGG